MHERNCGTCGTELTYVKNIRGKLLRCNGCQNLQIIERKTGNVLPVKDSEGLGDGVRASEDSCAECESEEDLLTVFDGKKKRTLCRDCLAEELELPQQETEELVEELKSKNLELRREIANQKVQDTEEEAELESLREQNGRLKEALEEADEMGVSRAFLEELNDLVDVLVEEDLLYEDDAESYRQSVLSRPDQVVRDLRRVASGEAETLGGDDEEDSESD